MSAMVDFLTGFAAAFWDMLVESAPWMLLGLGMAGLVRVFAPQEAVGRHLGGRSVASVVKAALLGIPLPVCSCGVVPTALGLRRQGAGPGATVSFLIATPETSVDALAVSWALLDPLMTLLRPVSGLICAVVAGVLVNATETSGRAPAGPSPFEPVAASGCGCDAGCASGCSSGAHDAPAGLGARLREALHFGYEEMAGDIGGWFLLGLVLAGSISVLLPPQALQSVLGSGLGPMLAMLLLGLPLHGCATSSTPIAAALALKGLSPGAALVFLLTGPASNMAGITIMSRTLGWRTTGIYLAAMAVTAVVLGLITDALYAGLGLNAAHWATGPGESGHDPLSIICAVVLLALVVRALRKGGCGCAAH